MNIEQQQERSRICERFLTAHAPARYLCQHIGMADIARYLVPVLWDLYQAHRNLVNREAMTEAKPLRMVSYKADLFKQLEDPEFARLYLKNVRATGDKLALRIARKDVAEAKRRGKK